MRLLQWITSSLRAKLLTLFVILTSIPLIAVGSVSYQKSFNTVSSHSKTATLMIADQLGRDIDILFQDVRELLELSNNPTVHHFLYSQTETYEDAKEILTTFDLYRETYKYESVLNISMVNLYGKGISEKIGVFQLDVNPLRNPHFTELLNHPDQVLNITPSDAEPLDRLDGFQYQQPNVISIMAAVKQQITHEVIGFIVIDLDDSIVEQFVDHTTIGQTGFFHVIDERGKAIFVPSQINDASQAIQGQPLDLQHQFIQKRGSFVESSKGKPQFIAYTTSAETGWIIVGSAPLQEIVQEANEIRQVIIVSVALSILFTITLYFFMTRWLIRPVQLLKKQMRQAASGFLEAKVKTTGQDEIADLGKSFNTMLEQIKMLLEKSIQEQDQIQKAELRTLQAQINPHFLYNTLDSIVWMAEANKNAQVIQLVQALSRFFRISLSKGRDWIPLRDELEHVQSYLIIQQMRYRDILQYDIQVEPALLDIPILKMSLQPIVENALYHGIKNKRRKGLIRISAREEQKGIFTLIVEDDGIGITSERMKQIQTRLDVSSSQELIEDDITIGFGLYNVHQRVRLYYGQHYGVTIESVELQGTRVSLRIPIERRDST
ncbi:histidine kinase [Paenibacillus crassostreae]|uniref:Histidine kinase n=2 Tax=Paenibacillus crassostreae TaxID=1763538 RepID=A0A167AR28_9BACL|nr:two-component sensor histidine kinase [Paenibacillus crassostreae]OAB71336.1 histidine kinase [Paenibacillus crassostreae]